MQIDLRPLSLGELLDRTFQLYRERFLLFAGIASAAAACQMLLGAVQNATIRSLQFGHHHNSIAASIWISLSSLLVIAATVVFYTVVFAAITRAVTALYLNEPTGVRKAYAEVWPQWFRYVRLAVTAGLLAWWPMVVMGVVVVSFIALGRHAATGATIGGGAAALVGLMFFLLILIGLPICLWLLVRYSLSQPACVTEGLKVRASIQRSVQLSSGLRWRIFLLLFIGYIFQAILSLLLTSPTIGATLHAHGHVPLWALTYNLVAGFCINTLAVPIYGIGLTLFYFDARIRKEGFDIELLLNRMAPAAPAIDAPGDPAAGLSAG